MRKINWFLGVGAGLAMGLITALLLSAFITPDPAARVKVINVPACAFQVKDKKVDFFSDGARLYLQKGPGEYIRAPLFLPHKVKILKMELVCIDDNEQGSIRVWLHRVNNDGSVSGSVGRIESVGASPEWRIFGDSVIDERVLDNVGNCYFINLRLPGTQEEGYVFGHLKVYYKGKW